MRLTKSWHAGSNVRRHDLTRAFHARAHVKERLECELVNLESRPTTSQTRVGQVLSFCFTGLLHIE